MYRLKLNRQALGIIIGFVAQFFAGMLLNLFVNLPAKRPAAYNNDYFTQSWHNLIWSLASHGGWQLAVHVWLALVLVLGTISLFVCSIVFNSKRWIICSGLAMLFTLGAFFNGLSFIDFNKNVSSFIMATCWLIGLASLSIGIGIESTYSRKKKIG